MHLSAPHQTIYNDHHASRVPLLTTKLTTSRVLIIILSNYICCFLRIYKTLLSIVSYLTYQRSKHT